MTVYVGRIIHIASGATTFAADSDLLKCAVKLAEQRTALAVQLADSENSFACAFYRQTLPETALLVD